MMQSLVGQSYVMQTLMEAVYWYADFGGVGLT